MLEIMSQVLQAEQDCAERIAQAERSWQERLRCQRDGYGQELARLKASLEQAGRQRLQQVMGQSSRSCAAVLENIGRQREALQQDGHLCAALQQRIIDLLLE